MYEETNETTFDPSEVVIKSSDGDTADEVMSVVGTPEVYNELQAIHNEVRTIREISLLVFVAILLVFIFKFLFGQLSAWFSA